VLPRQATEDYGRFCAPASVAAIRRSASAVLLKEGVEVIEQAGHGRESSRGCLGPAERDCRLQGAENLRGPCLAPAPRSSVAEIKLFGGGFRLLCSRTLSFTLGALARIGLEG